jgi:cytochrome P450
MSLLTGEMGEFRRDPLDLLERLARDQGDFAHLRFGLNRGFLLSHPSMVEEVLVTHNQYFRKSPGTRRLGSLLGHGLLSSDGQAWLRKRRLTQPAFHRERVAAAGEVMVDYSRRLLDTWQPGAEFDVQQHMMELTLQIACKTLFGADVAEDVEIVRQATTVVSDHFLSRLTSLLFLMPDSVPTPGNQRYMAAVRELDRLVYRIIEQHAADDRDDSLLSMLLAARATEDGAGLSDHEIRDEVMTFFLAGHETTALALTWALYLLAKAPHTRERLYREIEDVLDGRPPTVEDVGRLPFTRAVVDEALRIYPPAYLQGREALRDCTIGGHHIKRGMTLIVSQWVIHRDPRFWDQPNEFVPERWLDGTLVKRLPRFAYFPFGGGQRQCIGSGFAQLEAVLILACVAQRAALDLVSDEPVATRPLITLRPKYGIRMRVAEPTLASAHPLIAVS